MIKVGVKDRIELTDMKVETSLVFSSLLDIMIKGANILDVKSRSDRTRIVKFAQKYDFAHELRAIKHQLQIGLHDPKGSPRSIFKIAMLLDETELCKTALKKAAGDWKWGEGCEPGNEKEFGESIKGAKVFDLAGGSLSNLKAMPIEIVWALLRASHKPSTKTGSALQAEHDAMAEKFSRLMALKGYSSSSLDKYLG